MAGSMTKTAAATPPGGTSTGPDARAVKAGASSYIEVRG
jgi:hypothetical protein